MWGPSMAGPNCLPPNTTKTKEDFSRSKTLYQSFCIDGGEIETVQTCKYLGVVLDNKLEWSANIDSVWEGAEPSLYVLSHCHCKCTVLGCCLLGEWHYRQKL